MWAELWLPFSINTIITVIQLAIKNPAKKLKYWASLRQLRDLLIILIPISEASVDLKEAKARLKVA